MKRQRGRGRKPGGGGGGGGNNNHNHGNRSLESNGPDVKIRGTAAQIYEKYAQFARDAQVYSRVLNGWMQGDAEIGIEALSNPTARAIVSDVCTRAGFPPIILTEVNFQAMFEAQQAQAAAQNGNGGSRIITGVN